MILLADYENNGFFSEKDITKNQIIFQIFKRFVFFFVSGEFGRYLIFNVTIWMNNDVNPSRDLFIRKQDFPRKNNNNKFR